MAKFRGDYLKALRKERGVKQAEIGAATGVSGAAVGSWERGVNVPPGPAVEQLAKFFSVSVSNFWEDENGKVKDYTVTTQGDLLRLVRDLHHSEAIMEILPQDNADLVRISFPAYNNGGSNEKLINALKGINALFQVDSISSSNAELSTAADWDDIIDAFVDRNAGALDSEPLDCSGLPF